MWNRSIIPANIHWQQQVTRVHFNKHMSTKAVLMGSRTMLPWNVFYKSTQNCIFHPVEEHFIKFMGLIIEQNNQPLFSILTLTCSSKSSMDETRKAQKDLHPKTHQVTLPYKTSLFYVEAKITTDWMFVMFGLSGVTAWTQEHFHKSSSWTQFCCHAS